MALAPLGLVAASRGGGARGAPAEALPADPIADAVESVMRVTVTLEGDGVYGSGILIDPPRGLILTSLHVVSEMKTPKATLFGGRTGPAQVLARDKKLDLALLSAPALRTPDLPPPRFGDSNRLRPGEEVYAIGMPHKLPFTVSRGIVAYVGRRMEEAKYLQVDMSINDGNSGGPVFTRRGEIVGVMSFILRRSQGLSFALPMSYASAAFPELMAPVAAHALEAGLR